MKGIFCNSRGLADLAKRRFLAETSIEQKLNFIALLETRRDNFTSQFLGTLSGGMILIGTVYLLEEVPVGYCWGLGAKC